MNQFKINVGRTLSQYEKDEIASLFESISESEFKAYQLSSEEQLQEAGVIEPVFDQVSSDPFKEEIYYEESDTQKIVEFAVMLIISESGILSEIKENTASFYMNQYEGRLVEF